MNDPAPTPGRRASAAAARIMTAGVARQPDPRTQVCIRCSGGKFDRPGFGGGSRSCRKCPRCKGRGFVEVGNTKR